MIFVTVGAQMPFDRLIEVVDRWAEERGRTDVVAQIGPSAYVGSKIETTPFLGPEDFRAYVRDATAIVGHAGMGTIISALQAQKPLLVLPRRASLGETRNDHQVATAERFGETGRILSALTTESLQTQLDHVESFRPPDGISDQAEDRLLERLRTFVAAPGR